MQNGGFETGQFGFPWEGRFTLNFNYPDSPHGTIYADVDSIGISQRIPTNPGQLYTVGLFLAPDHFTSPTGSLMVQFDRQTIALFTTGQHPVGDHEPNGWEHFQSMPFQATSVTASLSLFSVGHWAHIDDVVVLPVPEPSVTAMVIAGVCLIVGFASGGVTRRFLIQPNVAHHHTRNAIYNALAKNRPHCPNFWLVNVEKLPPIPLPRTRISPARRDYILPARA